MTIVFNAAITSAMLQKTKPDSYKNTHTNDDQNSEYGYMRYSQCYNSGTEKIVFKIFNTSHDINLIKKYLKQYIISCINKKESTNILFFKVVNVDAKYVSYDFIKRCGFPWLNIKVCSSDSNNMCIFNGDQDLFDMIYDELDFLIEYNDYVKKLESYDYSKLRKLYHQTFGTYPNYYIYKHSRTLNDLLKHKRKEIINQTTTK